MSDADAAVFVQPELLYSWADVLTSPCPVPARPGVYGWWFRALPVPIETTRCVNVGGCTLLYAGISPKAPPANGRPPSRENLKKRIITHFTGNAEGSTLRKTLGCLLAVSLGIELRRVGSGNRMTFGRGEQLLSGWMGENAFVSWVECEQPWELEEQLIASLDLPLNLQGNAHNTFHAELKRIRKDCAARARALPVIPNPGVGGR